MRCVRGRVLACVGGRDALRFAVAGHRETAAVDVRADGMRASAALRPRAPQPHAHLAARPAAVLAVALLQLALHN